MATSARLAIFFGEDEFSQHQAVEELRSSLGPREEIDANTTQFSMPGVSVEQVQAACLTVPFLAPARLVVIRGLLAEFERGTSYRGRASQASQRKTSLGTWEALSKIVPDFPATTVLLLLDASISQDNPLLQALRPLGGVRQFPLLRGEALRRWVLQRTERKGGRLTAGAVRLLVDLIGSNLWAMETELEKLLLYAGPEAVTEADVTTLVSRVREANVFSAVDALLEGRSSMAVTLMHQLLADGASVSYLLSMLARQNRLLLITEDLLGHGVPTEEFARRLGVTAEFVVRKSIEQARRYRPEILRHFHQRILETDIAMKTGEIDEEVGLELLLGEMTRRSPS